MSAFEVLAEPHRRHILDLLREGERSVSELVRRLGLKDAIADRFGTSRVTRLG